MTKFERICAESVPPYAMLICLVVFAIVFMARAPVVVVGDDYFSAVYGKKREHYKSMEMSARLFRRIKQVRIAVNAQREAIAFAAEDASKNPYFIVFPYRYAESAKKYMSDLPHVTTFITARSSDMVNPIEGAVMAYTLTDLDYYRAGLCAAMLSQMPRVNADAKIVPVPNSILYIDGVNGSSAEKNLFASGVEKISAESKVTFADTLDPEATIPQVFSTVALLNRGYNFLNTNLNSGTRLIVFTWLDPDFTPPNVDIVIDDSPLAMLSSMANAKRSGDIREKSIRMSADFILLPLRIKDIKTLIPLRAALLLKP
jgi:hypothetical protein